MVRAFVVIPLLGALFALTACDSGDSRIGWELDFEDETLRARAFLVEGTILEGGCTGTLVRYTGLATMSASPPPPPVLTPGRYGFAGRARDSGCTWFADGCVDVDVPADGQSTVVVVLGPDAESAACPPAECVDGLCEMDVFDAGPDADASTDTAVDSIVTDVSPDAPCTGEGTPCAGGTCYGGSCCTGCWDGAACLGGDANAACGSGGADCIACDCECAAGACTAPAVSDVVAGADFTCAIDAGGSLYCWGNNVSGQLGQGTSGVGTELLLPAPVGARTDWDEVGAGDEHTCAIPTDGTLHCWGDNEDGQIGTGDMMDMSVPGVVGTAMSWSLMEGASGGDHTCILRGDATLHCMGQNNFGQLGLGMTVDQTAPVQVPGSWRALSLGHHATCAVRTDGTLWCWGENNRGQLGIGSPMDQSTPQQITTNTDWTAVGAGDSHSCAIRGGRLFCWGYNNTGQLGDGTMSQRTTPVSIGTDTDWVAVDGGLSHTCALKSTGEVFCAGGDADGQLGDGAMGGVSTTFTRVVDIDDADMIVAGDRHNCARVGDGSLRCWGSNGDGALGRGDRTTRDRPVAVCVGP
jgi:alpha-tubulin suppressor-like RCC1 family protein